MKYSPHKTFTLASKSDMTRALLVQEIAEEFMEKGMTPRFRKMSARMAVRNNINT